MADDTADSDWIDCHALRRDEEAGGNRQGEGNGDGLNPVEWRPGGLRLIDPEDETEEKARREAEAAKRVREAAEEKARREAEAKAKAEAEKRAREAAEAKARAEAEEKARRKAEEKARRVAEEKARRETEEKARRETEEKARREAEEKARKEAEAKARREAEEKARREAEAKAKAEAEKRAREEAKARAEAEEKARREAQEKARREAEEKARKEAEAKARREAEEKARREAETKAKADAEKRAREEAEARTKAEAEEAARREAKQLAEAKTRAAELGKTFRRLIREAGPISLTQFMGESNARYYASRDPLGAQSDFITAPEISQMFGELIGLWLADLWVKMGTRRRAHYVELGPGRGTLATDALRAAAPYGFEPYVHFVEGSPALRKLQREAFPDCIHHEDLSTLPEDVPLLIVANEFFDALPIHQLVRSANGWHERMVGLEDDRLVFVAGDKPMDTIIPPSWKSAPQGSMIETSPAAVAVMGEIATRLTEQGGAALIIDYGPRELRGGSTLQAIRAHEKVDVLSHPGEADLTAHVDFELLQHVALSKGAEVMGLQEQGEWLRQLGIDTRLEALQRKAPAQADILARQHRRLVSDDQMGTLFKVLGICGRRWPHGAGFD